MADTLLQQKEGLSVVKVFITLIYGVCEPDAAYEQFLNNFEESELCHEGWEMVNAPGKLDITPERIAEWRQYVIAAEVLPFRSTLGT